MVENTREHDANGHPKLRLPDDNVEAWKVMLYAHITRSLPALFSTAGQHDEEGEAYLSLLVHCWLLGAKYGAAQFQDLVMAEILENASDQMLPRSTIVLAATSHVQSPSMTKLFALMAIEEARRLVILHSGLYMPPEHDLGRNDLHPWFIAALRFYVPMSGIWLSHDRYRCRENRSTFMVEHGPDRRWPNVPYPFCRCHPEVWEQGGDNAK